MKSLSHFSRRSAIPGRPSVPTLRASVRNGRPAFTCLVIAGALCAAVAGCFSPHTLPTRHFVLASLPAAAGGSSSNVRLGVRVAGMPEYLLGNSLAVRQGANEIHYLETALWAERLDKGFERVLGANLSTLVPTDHVRLGAWRPDDVTLEVAVVVEQFDVDKDGKGSLVARWRITSPGGAKVLKSGAARQTKPGKPLAGDPQNLVTTLSELTADFSRVLAQAVKDAPPQ